MTKNFMALLSALVFALLVSVAVRAWRERIKRQEAEFSAPFEALEFFGELLANAKGFYVATTTAINHLERIAAYGLGLRGAAQVMVFSEGVLIIRNGENPIAIDRSQLSGVNFGQAAIDKSVEPEGLLQVNWQQDNVQLTTHMRIQDQTARKTVFDAIEGLTKKEVSR